MVSEGSFSPRSPKQPRCKTRGQGNNKADASDYGEAESPGG